MKTATPNITSLKPKLRFKEYEENWNICKLGNIAEFSKGSNISKADINERGNNKCIRYGELYTEYSAFINKVKSRTNIAKDGAVLSQKNDILMPTSDVTPTGLATASALDEPDVILGGDILIIRSNQLHNAFFSYYIRAKRKEIMRLVSGVTVYHLYGRDLSRLGIMLPSLKEQQKIADFLRSVDKWIDNLRAQKEYLEAHRKSMMQKIFSQEIRFKDVDGKSFPDWVTCEVGSVIKEYSKRTTDSILHPVLTSSNKGLILQTDYYGEKNRITERNNSTYNVLPEGYITYRSRSDTGIFYFNKNDLGYAGLVSGYYPVFTCKEGDNNFLTHYLNFNWKMLFKYSVGTSQKVLSFNELKKILLRIPQTKEQQKISSYISLIDLLIETRRQVILQAEFYKKGLLQEMFV